MPKTSKLRGAGESVPSPFDYGLWGALW